MAQVSPPDMRLPIALGLSWPERINDAAPANRWDTSVSWTFEPLDDDAFPAVALAREAGGRGGTAPAVFNAANEVCVEEFLAGRLPFLAIVDTVAQVLGDRPAAASTPSLDDVLGADAWARARARELTAGVGVR
jgi:1-deoxy-D-xylulose-5-phosphate reductoisomerase